MNIKILCPKCYAVLRDQFSSKSCSIVLGESYWLNMECLSCNCLVRVNIIAVPNLVSAASGPIRAMLDVRES